jgi:hypothetical protein
MVHLVFFPVERKTEPTIKRISGHDNHVPLPPTKRHDLSRASCTATLNIAFPLEAFRCYLDSAR